MKTLSLALLMFVLVLTGCTHTRQVGSESTAETSFEDMNQTLEGRSVDIHLRDGRTMASTALRLRPDTTWSIDQLNGRLREAPSGEIAAVTHTRYGKGAIEGALLGAAGGALVGLAAGLGLTSVREADVARTSVGYYVSVPTIFFTLVGIGTGSMLGISKGSQDRYVYPDLGRYVSQAEKEPEAPAQAQGTPRLRQHP